jgi:hypothetical protein
MSKRSLMLVNSLFRMSYGLGALLVPSKMADLKLAADTAGHPEARLFVRGFGAHQIAVAAVGLASRRRRGLEQPAAVAAIAIDVADMLSALVEARNRGQVDADLYGGLVFSAAGVATSRISAAVAPARRTPWTSIRAACWGCSSAGRSRPRRAIFANGRPGELKGRIEGAG